MQLGRMATGAAPCSRPFLVDEVARGLRDGEFEAHFQPRVHMASRRLATAEAVARWRHPDRGIVMPWEFMPAIEEGGLALELTEAILASALAERSRWRAAGLAAAVSVNLSWRGAEDPSIAERLARIAAGYGADPRHVVLEVTESAGAVRLDGALENLSRLRMRGFGIAIDDHGTGCSPLERLASLPFTELKIDSALVRDAACPGGQAVLESSVEVAARLGLRTVAEGVETQSEWELLAALGCDQAQGYYLGAPMTSAEFVTWMRPLPWRELA